MFPLQPKPRRIATNPDQQIHAVVCCDQREARRHWFRQPFLSRSHSYRDLVRAVLGEGCQEAIRVVSSFKFHNPSVWCMSSNFSHDLWPVCGTPSQYPRPKIHALTTTSQCSPQANHESCIDNDHGVSLCQTWSQHIVRPEITVHDPLFTP